MDITTNPWIILASDVSAAPLTVWPYNVHIRNIEFAQYIATTDFALINQINGKEFAFLSADSDLETVKTNNVEWARGIVIPQGGITNGKVLIYIR
jgi:hypothetical protein